ncbi:MAG: YARHG domain-containing protein [Blastocatellales bacterium]
MSEDLLPTHKPCPQCGGIVAADSRFCKHCAFNLAEAVPASTNDNVVEDSSSGKRKYVLLAGCLALALALALVVMFVYKSRSSAAYSPSAANQTMGERAIQVENKILQGQVLSSEDVAGLSSYELRVLRNVHFARYGRSYDRPGLGDYFYTRPWYRPSAAYNDNLLTSIDKANINVILPEENRAKAAEIAAAAANTPATANDSSDSKSFFSSGSQLTTENVQRAVVQLLDWTKKGGTARVIGIREVPQQNIAQADIRFEDFQYNSTDLGTPVSKNQAPPPKPDINSPNYWSDMAKYTTQQVRVSRFSGEGVGILKHYNDGRWVLTGVQFNFVGVSGNIQIQ